MTLKRVYAKEESHGFVWGLLPDDFAKVKEGYACHNCLEEFTIGGMPIQLPKCPVCQQEQDWALNRMVDKPQGW